MIGMKTMGGYKTMGNKTSPWGFLSKFGTKKAAPKATTSGKSKTSGHDPLSKKTGATATTHGSTYDYRKGSQAKKPASSAVSHTKPKTSSVTVGTAGSHKKTTTTLGTKPAPKTVGGKKIISAPAGGWGSKNTVVAPKKEATKTTHKKDQAVNNMAHDTAHKAQHKPAAATVGGKKIISAPAGGWGSKPKTGTNATTKSGHTAYSSKPKSATKPRTSSEPKTAPDKTTMTRFGRRGSRKTGGGRRGGHSRTGSIFGNKRSRLSIKRAQRSRRRLAT